jgi:sugar/nucleoside kinase (ribokinase family)
MDQVSKLIGNAATPVFVDPKKDMHKFKDTPRIVLVTPNHNEALDLTKESKLAPAMMSLMSAFQSKVAITRGGEGVAVYSGGELHYIKPPKVEVADVQGAGDSFIAGAVFWFLKGRPHVKGYPNVIKFASQVAAIAVQHKGTYVVQREDIKFLEEYVDY